MSDIYVRHVIDFRALDCYWPAIMSVAYKKAGVDIDGGNEFVNKIKEFVSSTNRSGVLGPFGGFGGFFAIDTQKYKNPLLVSGTDGVGTKLKLAIEMEKYDSVGQDLVAMCVNDIACSGAEPLFFLDYLAAGKLDPTHHADVVKGIAEACKACNCALIGGETAEMPGMYSDGDFDLAGFAVGVVERDNIIDGHTIGLNDSIIGISSNGFHSNGYSLIRKIIADNGMDLKQPVADFNKPLGNMLLTPTKLYSPVIQKLKEGYNVKAIAHITGGGLLENIPRVLPSSVQATIERSTWELPRLMTFLQEKGDISDAEMFRVFNCGIGMVLVVPADQADAVCETIHHHGDDANVIGSIEKRTDAQVSIK